MTQAVAKFDNETLMARQLSDQYQKAIGGLWEVLKFGAMMQKLRDALLTVTGHGVYEGSLKEWLDLNCPTVHYRNAQRFMYVADGLKREFQLGVKVDLLKLLDVDSSSLEGKQLKLRKSIEEFLEGKSQRQLLFHFANPEPLPRGGHHPGENPPLSGEARKKSLAEKFWSDELILRLYEEGVDKKSWQYLSIERLLQIQTTLITIARDVKDILDRKKRG